MKTEFRRIVSTAVAVLIALSTVLVCAPVPAAAAEGHCKPDASPQPASSHCPQKDALDCCMTSAPEPSSVPTSVPAQGTAGVSAMAPVPADTTAIAHSLQVPDLARALRQAPLHGYRSTDLPVLNATFLI